MKRARESSPENLGKNLCQMLRDLRGLNAGQYQSFETAVLREFEIAGMTGEQPRIFESFSAMLDVVKGLDDDGIRGFDEMAELLKKSFDAEMKASKPDPRNN
ncbi:hypothetical protein [Schlesneria paludicola]|uniref:hypothetical protein n=1 Tax=Schlesneria paludicola TaxID=360056 RepID=UPI00029A20BE|nr:hypothetical protein [Schlesneria paludicola]